MPTKKIYKEVKEIPEENVDKKKDEIYNPKDKELLNRNFIKTRIASLQKSRKDILGKDLEKIWKEADEEYIPSELPFIS